MIQWVVTIVIVMSMAVVALSSFWWLPELLAPLSEDPAHVESATTLVQLILWVLTGLLAVLGVKWALRSRKSGYKVMYADDLEAAAAQAAVSTPSEDLTGQPQDTAGTSASEAEALQGKQASAPADDESLSESLFGPDGAIPPGTLTPEGSQALDEAPPGEEQTLNEALFGPGAPLSSGVEEPEQPLAPDEIEQESDAAQAVPQSERAAVAALQARPPVPGARRFNLPADVPDFYGREPELAFLREELDRVPGSAAWYTPAISILAGMGGLGKTALALHFAHGLASEGRFLDAHLYLDLKGASSEPLSPAIALDTLLTMLLGPDPQRPGDEDTLAYLWRAALQDKQVLLVLDDARGAAQVRPLLPGSATCAVVITSQYRFALPGAGPLDLGSVELDDARAFLQRLVPRLEDTEAQQIAKLCGGLPLALRIAGNYLSLNDDLSPVVYAAHLTGDDTRLDLLRDPGEPDLDVVARLASSIKHLSESTRWSWTLLACLPAPFDVSAASAVWGQGSEQEAWQRLDAREALVRLRTLRNSSLLTYHPQTGRYGQHVLLRLAAGRELASLGAVGESPTHQTSGSEAGSWQDSAVDARRRMAYHFLEVAQSAEEDERYQDLDPDWPHLRAALEYASQLDNDLYSQLVQVLNNYWSDRGMAREQALWNDLAARGHAVNGRQEEAGVHLGALGAAYDDLGEPQQAIEAYGRAMRASRASGDQATEATHLRGVGTAYQQLGDIERALFYYQQSLDLSSETGNVEGETASLGCLGRAHSQLGGHRRAIGYFQRAVTLAREAGDRHAEGTWLGELATCYAELGDAHRAVKTSTQALAIVRETGSRPELAAQLVGLGQAYTLLNQAVPAPEAATARARTLDPVEVQSRLAQGQAWGDEVELTPIRQILVPAPRGVEVWTDSPFPPDLDLSDVVDREPATLDPVGLEALPGEGQDVDLLVQDIWSTTTPLTPRSWETIAFRIKNQGTDSTSKRFYVRMWFDNTLIRTWYVDGLGAGRTAVGWVQVKVAAPGNHYVRVQVDCSSCVSETNLDNNVRTETWFWGERSGAQGPSGQAGARPGDSGDDLLAGPEPVPSEWGEESELPGIKQIMVPWLHGVDVRTSQDPEAQRHAWDPTTSAAPGRADLVVQDIWSTSTPLRPWEWTTIAFRVLNQGMLSISARFYVRMWLDDVVVANWYVDGLEAGRTAVGWVQARVRDAGSHNLRVYADFGDAVPEPNTDNNERTETWVWGEPGAAEPPSGDETLPQPTGDNGQEGEAAQLAGPVPVARYWGKESELTRVRQTVTPSVPGVEVWADGALPGEGQTVDEARGGGKIGVDLTVVDLWSPTKPLLVGAWETIALRITNQGTDKANPRFYTRMWFDRTLIRTWFVDGLQAGATGVGWVQIRVAEPGSHRVRIQVDVTSAVSEVDEENNIRTETWEWGEPQPVRVFLPPVALPPAEGVDGGIEPENMGQLPTANPAGAGSAVTSAGNEQARDLWMQALAIYQEIGDPRSEDVRDRLDALDG